MYELTLIPPPLKPGETIIGVEYELSLSPTFDTKEDTSGVITENYLVFRSSKELDPTREYFARARLYLSTGATRWGVIETFTPKALNIVLIDADTPSAISVPKLMTSSDPFKHEGCFFTLTATGFKTLTTATLEATTWIIRKLDGTVVKANLKDRLNKEILVVNDVILTPGAYIVSAIFHSTSNDTSLAGNIMIIVGTTTKRDLLTNFNDGSINTEQPIPLGISWDVGVNRSEWKLITIKDGVSEIIWETIKESGNVFETLLPANILKIGTAYVLAVKTNIDDVTNYYPFSLGYAISDNSDEVPSDTIVNLVFISADPGNTITIGSDGGWYVGGNLRSSQW